MATEVEQTGSFVPSNWVDVPTFFVDGAIGSANANGLHRILMGSVTFNSELGAENSTYKPALELVMTVDAARALAEFLSLLPGVSDEPA